MRIKRELTKKLEAAQKGVLSAEEKAAIAARAFAEEEEAVKILNSDLMRKRDIHYRKQQVR